MKNNKYIFILFFIYLLLKEYNSSILLSDELIEHIQISKLENTQINGQSKIFTDKIYSSIKFFKIDFTSINELTEENIFSFIKISIKPKIENTYKTFFLFANKSLYDFQNSTDYYIDYNIQDKCPTIFLPKKFYNINKYIYFLFKVRKILNLNMK